MMKAILLYLLLLKATVSTFSGLASLPLLRNDLVLHRHLLTDAQLNTAVVVTRTTPGPVRPRRDNQRRPIGITWRPSALPDALLALDQSTEVECSEKE